MKTFLCVSIISALWFHTTPLYAQDMPVPLDQALAEAEQTPKLKISYTMRFEWPGAPAITTRYDARTEDWTILQGNQDALPGPARQKLRNVQKSESRPGGLLYADFREYLTQIELFQETDEQWIYSFIPPEADENDVSAGAEASIHARLYIDKEKSILKRYQVRAIEPVRPVPMVKLEEFVVEQDFERLGPDGPAVLVRLYSKQKGRRVFRQVDTEFTATFSDFEIIP